MRSGVILDTATVPGYPGKHTGFKGTLDAADVEKLILWWEFQDHTVDQNCRLTGLLPSAATLPRTRSFLAGNPGRCLRPLDWSTATNMDLVLVTNDIQNGWLYIIDGNHRAIAQAIRNRPFQDIPALVCVHPAMNKWSYIPLYYQRLWKRNEKSDIATGVVNRTLRIQQR